MAIVKFQVDALPPYKQAPASRAEQNNQTVRRGLLQERAREELGSSEPLGQRCAIAIHYSRRLGRSDSGNIVGGILDALQGIAYHNDNQVVEIRYVEDPGERDHYSVTLSDINPNGAGAMTTDPLNNILKG